MPLTDIALEAVLAADDWPFERAGDSTWFSAFQRSSGPGDPITFFLRLTDDWLFLTVAPFAVLPDDPTEDLTSSQIKDGLDALSYFALRHHAEITAVAGSSA